jgi:ubiquinone/menaquinone biosynthesis C-methylase UbiE
VTLGRVVPLHEAAAAGVAAAPGARVLEIGCGTGAVTQRLVSRGAVVTALDQSPDMLEQARRRVAAASPGRVTWIERTAAEIDALPRASFDAVVVSLALSEMSRAERRFVLRQAARLLRPHGVLAAADEVRPRARWKRAVHAVLRAPQAALGWLLAGSVSRPIPDLAAEVQEAGLVVRREERWLLGGLAAVIAERTA